jgi:glycopeptide antibiotics resistance protein
MTCLGYWIEITPIGILLLIGYIIVDCIRHKTSNLLRRFIFYSFILYLLFVFQYTTGGFHFPPQENFYGKAIFQLVPFYFVSDLLQSYQLRGLDWFFWKSVQITLYNLIMLFPLGVYLAALFNVRTIKKATLIILAVTFTIEIYQVVFSYFGLVIPRSFNVDDIILNTLGGMAGYYISKLVLLRWFHRVKKESP